jgi:polyhydroxyalkanoate synthase
MATQTTKRSTPGPRAATGAALDVMLTDAATAPGGARRFVPPAAIAKAAAGLARRPDRVARRAGSFVAELAHVAAGSSQLAAAKGDRRFTDPAWERNWLFRRLMQGYLAFGATTDELIADAQLDWREERRVRFAAGNVLDAVAPTNYPWSNPAVLKETIDRGGANLVTGARRFARDVSRSPRLPATVDTTKFEVGRNLAVSPGAVVLRTDVFELIHYSRRPSRSTRCRCCSSRRRSTSTT